MNSIEPVWDEEFVYKCSLKELAGERVLEVTIWDFDKRGSNDFIGGLRIGPAPNGTSQNKEWMDSIEEEAAHWKAMLAQPGEWVEQWHTLRPRMDRSIYILPQKPTRELSPVQETLSPTMGEEEVNTTTQASAPSLYDTRASSLSSATHVSDSTSADNSRSKPYPLKSSDKPNASNLSPLSQSKNQHKVPTVKADVSRSRSRSPSPIPELLVTSETAGIPVSVVCPHLSIFLFTLPSLSIFLFTPTD